VQIPVPVGSPKPHGNYSINKYNIKNLKEERDDKDRRIYIYIYV
jgi:hypothetical protein